VRHCPAALVPSIAVMHSWRPMQDLPRRTCRSHQPHAALKKSLMGCKASQQHPLNVLHAQPGKQASLLPRATLCQIQD
jgi:hypothetical protein